MPKFNDTWVVQPHGPLECLDDGLWTVAGEIVMPLGRFPRRMTIAALSEGRLAIWSPVPVDDATLRQIEDLGRISFLIVPGVGHRLDIRAWAARYSQAKILCPRGALKAVNEAVTAAATTDILDDAAVRFVAVTGVGEKDAALLIRREERLTLVVNDILANVRHPGGVGAKIMARLFGFGIKRPRMPRPVRRMFVKDGNLLAAQLRGWAANRALTRIVVSHGDVIEEDCRAVLERAAADLD